MVYRVHAHDSNEIGGGINSVHTSRFHGNGTELFKRRRIGKSLYGTLVHRNGIGLAQNWYYIFVRDNVAWARGRIFYTARDR